MSTSQGKRGQEGEWATGYGPEEIDSANLGPSDFLHLTLSAAFKRRQWQQRLLDPSAQRSRRVHRSEQVDVAALGSIERDESCNNIASKFTEQIDRGA